MCPISANFDFAEIFSRRSPPERFTEICPLGDALMCMRTDGRTWSTLAFISTMLTWKKILRGSCSNFSRQDSVGVWKLGLLTQWYNLSPATLSYYRILNFLMACHMPILTPLSKSHVGRSVFEKNFRPALKSKFSVFSFPKSVSWLLLLWLKWTIKSVETVKCEWALVNKAIIHRYYKIPRVIWSPGVKYGIKFWK